MKALLMVISLSLAIATMCICLFLGVRMEAAFWRAIIVFAVAYGGGMIVALVLTMTYLSTETDTEPATPLLPEAQPSEESIPPEEEI